jgi:hypothetical protein
MSEQWHPERLSDDNLFGRYAWNMGRAESHLRQAEKDLAELVLRGLIPECYPIDLEGQL